MEWISLSFIGMIAGIVGGFLGIGGGFIIIPFLIELYSYLSHQQIAAISLAVVFFNALVSVVLNSKTKKINLSAGIMMGIVAVPGAIIGTLLTSKLQMDTFKTIMAIVFIMVSIIMVLQPRLRKEANIDSKPGTKGAVICTIQIENKECIYYFSPIKGICISALVSTFSGMMGIGGGVFIVPMFVLVMKYPIQAAIGTSQMILLISSFGATVSNIFNNSLDGLFQISFFLVIGVIIGATIGSQFLDKLKTTWIITAFAVIVLVNGIRLLM